ncbi:XdhC family protein [Thalassospira australica]|uniref:XdhC family protein n=1 Tax=Thalassospira australica TaxID=1528106 RepID=UPI00384F90BF
MSNQLSAMLVPWHAGRNSSNWVLGTVYRTEGSAYRKAGAMMLVNDKGEHYGMLSGGCLEADIIRNARKAMQMSRVIMLTYDGTDDDDLSFRLGIGCGGKVFIMLQPVTPENDLGLNNVFKALKNRTTGLYCQLVGEASGYFVPGADNGALHSRIENRNGFEWLVTPVVPEPHLLVVGGGLDARPMVQLANVMGWRVTLADPRPANARPEHFPSADHTLRSVGPTLAAYVDEARVDAAILMSHSIPIDAEALRSLNGSKIRHVSALGPEHRFGNVLSVTGLTKNDLNFPLSSPAGLDIGGELPESIALSILSGIHRFLYRDQAVDYSARQAAE